MFTWLLFYGVSLTPAPSLQQTHLDPSVSVTAHAAALGTWFFLKGLCSTSEVHCFIPVMGKGTPAAQTAGERSSSHFPICIPRSFCPI